MLITFLSTVLPLSLYNLITETSDAGSKYFQMDLGKPLICRVGNSLFCSKSLTLKRDHEWFTHVALYERATVSHVSHLLVIQANSLQKQVICSKNSYFCYVFDSFPSFYAQERIADVALLLMKNDQFAQKSDKRIHNPANMMVNRPQSRPYL